MSISARCIVVSGINVGKLLTDIIDLKILISLFLSNVNLRYTFWFYDTRSRSELNIWHTGVGKQNYVKLKGEHICILVLIF